MMFDTLAVAIELKNTGFTTEQAEALARAWSHVATGDLATKADLFRVKSDLEQKISDVRNNVKVVHWMLGFSLVLLVLILEKLFTIHIPH